MQPNKLTIPSCGRSRTANIKPFVKASTSTPSSSSWNKANNAKTDGDISEDGSKIHDYYLSITNNTNLGDCDSDDDIILCKETSKFGCSSQVEFVNSDVSKAMLSAQTNDVETLRKLIEHGVSVDAIDSYGWSLLMVASCAGSMEVVKYLLEKNAKRGKRDSNGNTAIYLASKKNHLDVVSLLTKKEEGVKKNDEDITILECENDSNNSDTKSYFCEDSKMMTNCSKKLHESSIAHLFKVNSANKTSTAYGIPRSNIGFQMLLNQGWNESQGLGPEGSGMKYPLKVKKKNNRIGIGHIKEPNKTDKRVERNSRESLKSINKNIAEEKEKEKQYRRLLNDS